MYFRVWLNRLYCSNINVISESYDSCDVFCTQRVLKESHENLANKGFRFVAKFQKNGDSPMKYLFETVLALTSFVILAASSVQAETGKKMIVALKTHDFELTETDISSLAVGEAQTIETESGKVIDILRTVDGVELYVDGELLEMNFDDDALHEKHMVRKHVKIECENDEECDKNVVILSGDHHDLPEWITEEGDNVFIHKEIELSCSDDEEGTSCSDKVVWVSDGEESDLEEIHEMHKSGDAHKVIVIKKEIITED